MISTELYGVKMGETEPKGKTILELEPFDCRWVFDDGSFCGCKSETLTSWCNEHRARVFQPKNDLKDIEQLIAELYPKMRRSNV
jgi:hypothetical protein